MIIVKKMYNMYNDMSDKYLPSFMAMSIKCRSSSLSKDERNPSVVWLIESVAGV